MQNTDIEKHEFKRQVNFKRMTVSFLIAFLVMYLIYSKIDFSALLESITRINAGLYFLAMLAYYLTFIVKGIRWKILLVNNNLIRKEMRKVNKTLIEINFLSWFVNLLVPAKLGDIYRSYIFKKNYSEWGVSGIKTFGTIIIEHLIDIVVVLLMLGGISLFLFKTNIPGAIFKALLIALGIALLAVIGILFIKDFRKTITKLLPEFIRKKYENLEEGLTNSLTIRTTPILLLETILIHLLEAISLLLICLAFGVNINIFYILFTILAATLISGLPITPGGLGVVEGTIIGIFILLGIDKNIAAGIAILFRIVDYAIGLILGATMFALSKRNKI